MPKIDPSQLLDCLDSLLGIDGGIKGETEVKRLAVLMTKFSKKLVSKCIYILILKSTEPDLLARFMAEGGWALVFQWLDEGINNNNHALIREILELLLKCPISLDRLKENNCPKVVKGLSKDSESEDVKKIAGKLVEQWLKFIKSGQAAISDVAVAASSATTVSKPAITVVPSNITVVSTVSLNSGGTEVKKPSNLIHKISKPGIQIVKEVSSSDEDEGSAVGSLPLYKITVQDGKSVLAKVGTKTLSLPVSKKVETDVESTHSVTSVVLKSDPVSKKFRYITKTISDKEKSDSCDLLPEDTSNSSTKSDTSKLGYNVCEQKPRAVFSGKSACASVEKSDSTSTNKLIINKSKISKSKLDKEGSKLKDAQVKLNKTSKELDNSKSEIRLKDKDREKKLSRDSEKDRKKSEHKSHKTDKCKEKERDRSKEKNKVKEKELVKEKNKDLDRGKSKEKPEKSLSAADKAQIQADKDKDTLERLKTPALSLLGKIPKKSSSQMLPVLPKVASNFPSNKSESTESSEKATNIGSDSKKSIDKIKIRPKTVKTFNSKFRSTGLEEEIKPPPSRGSIKKKVEEKRLGSKTDIKHVSPPKEEQPPEKKLKPNEPIEIKKDKNLDKPGGIKLIPPKPKPALLESDMFSDALTASTKFEPRKRKRRISSSKDGSEAKKDIKEENVLTTSSKITSPKHVKPTFKFYRDTLEEDEDKNKENETELKSEVKLEFDDENLKPKSPEETKEVSIGPKYYPNGVLLHKSKKGPKKSVKWKVDAELTAIRTFELDETERVNVTRTFVDMKLMERSHEREAFQLARKLASEDIMEEKTTWGLLYEVDIPPDRRSTVESGKSSLEKNVQYAREKTVLQAIYFNRSSIPDSPAEPDPEVHPTTDPKIIPLDDITGNTDSVSNFQNIPWPEPKPALVQPSSPQSLQMGTQHQQLHSNPQPGSHPPGFGPGYSSMNAFPAYSQMGMPGMMPPGQGNWRSGDGKEVNLNIPFQPNGPMCPQMAQPPNMFNPSGPEGFSMNGPSMPSFHPGYPIGCDPNMYGPPMGTMAIGGPPPGQWNRGGGGGWQGGRPFMGPMNMQTKFQKGVCHHFAKFGNCARGNSCRFMHPN